MGQRTRPRGDATGILKPLFGWRSAICDSDLPPTARHVALTLSLHMSERGDSCHPGAARLAAETGLTERSVRRQLAELTAADWLRLVEPGGRKGDTRRANAYEATIPEPALAFPTPDPGTTFTREPHSPVNLETRTPEPDDTAPLNDVHPRTLEISLHEDVEKTPAHFVRAPTTNGAVTVHALDNLPVTTNGTRLPERFVISPAMREWAATNVSDVDVDRETAKFADYWRSAPGAKGRKLDWLATWRNWLRKAAELNYRGPRRTTPDRPRGFAGLEEYAKQEGLV